jgi:uncharacterized protein (TIGR03435 family)
MLRQMRTPGHLSRFALVGTALLAVMLAQKTTPVFEVVSVKPADPAAIGRLVQSPPGGFRGRNLRLLDLIMIAWQLHREQIAGGPNWLETLGWDIDARGSEGTVPAQVPAMMKAMLADRFALTTHWESRTLPVYLLTVEKSGLKLHKGDGRGAMSAGRTLIRYSSVAMPGLAGQLSGYLGRNVVDKTGITGEYAVDLSFAPADPNATGGDSKEDAAPSIFQALQEQAGLKLIPAKAPVQLLFIDHAEKATPN